MKRKSKVINHQFNRHVQIKPGMLHAQNPTEAGGPLYSVETTLGTQFASSITGLEIVKGRILRTSPMPLPPKAWRGAAR